MNAQNLDFSHGVQDHWHELPDEDFGPSCRKQPSTESPSVLKATTTCTSGGPFPATSGVGCDYASEPNSKVYAPRCSAGCFPTQFPGLREVVPCHSTGGYSPTAVLVKQHSDMERTSLSQVPPSYSIATARMGNKWRTDAGVRGLTRPPWTVTQDTLTPSQAWLYRVTASLYARTRPGGGHSVLV